jgi:hypothetical protein
MSKLSEHRGISSQVKILCAANSGAGKTGALAPLVDAGFNVRVLDFDDGLTPLAGYVKDKSKLDNVSYVTLRDDMKLMGARIGIKKANAFQECMDVLDDGKLWGDPAIGPVSTWTSKDILVLDTLGMAGKAALYMVMAANGAALKAPELQHYGTAMDNIEKLLMMLTSKMVPCHLIVNTHITQVDGYVQLFPDALGSKLSPKIGRYFDNMISLEASGSERKFKTKKAGLFPCKTAMPMADSYDISNGWVEIFKTLLSVKDFKGLLGA